MLDTTRRRLKVAAWTLVLCCAIIMFLIFVPMKLYITSSTSWIEANPMVGAMILPLLLAASIPLCIPSPGIEILAGSMFGIVLGALLCVIGKTIGQLFAFLAASFFGKNRISIYMKTNFPTFAALTVVLQNSNWKVLLLIQVANVPHLVKCFGLAITDISTYKFAVSSALGGLPYAILWTYIGYHSKNLIAHDEAVTLSNTSFQDRILIGAGGTILTILGMWWLMVYTKKQLRIELLQVKHLHSTGINSTDKCITIVSS